MGSEVERIAKGLSKAQARYLRDAVFRSPIAGYEKRWMTFPPPNTHMVLRRHDLMDWGGQLSAKGIAVRDYLLWNPNA